MDKIAECIWLAATDFGEQGRLYQSEVNQDL